MKVMKTREVPARTEEYVAEVQCDICHLNVEHDLYADSSFAVGEVEVTLKTGVLYPESGSGDLVEFDICPECFEKKLVPALQELGANPRRTLWHW